jgi:hypothetical protein
MDPEIVEALESCWSDFSPSNMETALLASITRKAPRAEDLEA